MSVCLSILYIINYIISDATKINIFKVYIITSHRQHTTVYFIIVSYFFFFFFFFFWGGGRGGRAATLPSFEMTVLSVNRMLSKNGGIKKYNYIIMSNQALIP